MANKKTLATPDRQYQGFVEAARELGADGVSEKRFDAALRMVGSAPPAPMPKPNKGDARKKRARRK